MVDHLQAATARITGKTKGDILFKEIQGKPVVINKENKTGLPAEGFETNSPRAGKKIENFCALDAFTKDTEQGFPRLVRSRPDTLVMKGRGKEFPAFSCPADNSQKRMTYLRYPNTVSPARTFSPG